MKILWAFIVLVLVAGAWMALRPAGSATAPGGQTTGTVAPPASRVVEPAPEAKAEATFPSITPPLASATPPEAATQPATAATTEPVAEPVVTAPETVAPAPVAPAPAAVEIAATHKPSDSTSTTSAPVPDILNELLGLDLPPAASPEAAKPGAPGDAPATPVATPAGLTATGEAGEAVPAADGASGEAVTLELSEEVRGKFKEIAPSRARRSADGFLLLDERFPVKGEGTREKPYELTWEMLVSASETYQPRMGKLRMPERIAMLDKRYVRITGYVAFPIMASAQNEMLSMRNMWDGCCIGVPPTPYDAIEVKLGQAATGKERFTSFGAVEGLFRVDPYVKGNWLLGLYLLEEASLVTLKEGQDPTKHRGM